MRREFTVQSTAPTDFVTNRIILYLKTRGYSVTTQPACIVFSRGSLWGSLTSFNPAKWKARINLRVSPKYGGITEVAITCNVNTTGQTVIKAEIDFWDDELGGLAQVIGADHFDLASVRTSEQRARLMSKFDMFLVLGVSIIASLLFTFFVAPLISAVFNGLTWEEILRTDTITRLLENILLPMIGGTITRYLATGAVLIALFIGAFQPLRQRLQNSLDEVLQALPPNIIKAAHVALDVCVVLCILVALNVGYNLVSHAPPLEQQRLIWVIVIGLFTIVIVAAVQQMHKKRQHAA
jgi:hypothetical protein